MPYIGALPDIGSFTKLDAISAVNGQAAYTMQKNSVNFSPASVNQMLVSLNGVIQSPGSSFTISAHTLTFASNLSTGDVIDFIIVYGDVLNVGTVSDATITNDKLATAPTLISKGAGSDSGAIQLNCEVNTHGVKIKGPPHSAAQSYTLTLPSTAPAANKMLQSDGSGNLSFVDTPSGGLKLLQRTVVSSSTASVAFNSSVIDSTYDDYLFRMNDVIPVSDGAYPQWRTAPAGGSYDSGWYSNSIFVRFDNSNSGGNGVTSNQAYMKVINAMGTGTGEIGNYEINLIGVNSSGRKAFYGRSTQKASNGLYYHTSDGYFRDADGTVGYFDFYFSTGNIASGTFSLYGLVKS